MTETLLFVGIGSILLVGVATLGTAVLTLRSARQYVELAEERMEGLREGQARLLLLLHEERQRPNEARERYHESPQPTEEDLPSAKTLLREETSSEIDKLPASSTRETASGHQKESQKVSTENRRTPLALRYPHPDDDVTPRRTSAAGQSPVRSDAPMKMFRTIYDRYLDNYEGYVKLTERLYRLRDNDEMIPESLAEREWEKRLRRINDGIERTVERLDILEASNPELANDDRVSQRASIAQHYSELTAQYPKRGVMSKEQVGVSSRSPEKWRTPKTTQLPF